jgi:hypothetical protein
LRISARRSTTRRRVRISRTRRGEILFGANHRLRAHALHRFVFGGHLEAGYRLAEAFLKISAAQFAIGKDRIADRLLPRDDVAYRLVLGADEFLLGGFATLVGLEHAAQFGRRAQPADLIDAQLLQIFHRGRNHMCLVNS